MQVCADLWSCGAWAVSTAAQQALTYRGSETYCHTYGSALRISYKAHVMIDHCTYICICKLSPYHDISVLVSRHVICHAQLCTAHAYSDHQTRYTYDELEQSNCCKSIAVYTRILGLRATHLKLHCTPTPHPELYLISPSSSRPMTDINLKNQVRP